VITNLTPHPIRIYGWDVPERFNLGDHEPWTVLEPSGTVARIGEIDLSTTSLPGCDAPVTMIEYRHADHAGIFDRAPHQLMILHALAVIGDCDNSALHD